MQSLLVLQICSSSDNGNTEQELTMPIPETFRVLDVATDEIRIVDNLEQLAKEEKQNKKKLHVVRFNADAGAYAVAKILVRLFVRCWVSCHFVFFCC